ncbi:MAG TPA: Hsp20 family protein [Stellaceae bacterium]|nr:Hsp20 family protein [Stellaceae bacterium]
MRTFDFAPVARSTIGFDRMLELFEEVLRAPESDSSYPPYNIKMTGEDSYSLEIAVAGFTPEALSITVEQNLLTVTGNKPGEETGQYLHQGIPVGTFERRFHLAEFIKVVGASLNDGILKIDLVREVPEAMKPRKVPIGAGATASLEKRAA